MPNLLVLLATLALLTPAAFAAMPDVANIDHAEAFATGTTPEQTAYNFKVGSATTDLSSRFQIEYNDNITQAETGKVDDTILRANLISKTIWPLTDLNALTLDLDLGYRYYLDNTNLNSNQNFLDVNPGSELAFKWWIKNFSFKVYDQLNYSVTSADNRAFSTSTNTIVTNVIDYAILENRAGLQVEWDLNDLKVYTGYARDDVRADDDAFKSIDRTAHTVYLSPLFQLNPELSVGLLSSYTWNDFDLAFQNDSNSFAVGPTVYWQATENTAISADIYLRDMSFDSGAINTDNDDVTTWNGSLKLQQYVNDAFRHTVALTRETEYGQVTNATTVNRISYTPVYQLRENLALKGRLAYEDAEDTNGVNKESTTRRIIGAGLNYTFSNKLNTELAYSYANQGSNLVNRSYDQNRVLWTINYDF